MLIFNKIGFIFVSTFRFDEKPLFSEIINIRTSENPYLCKRFLKSFFKNVSIYGLFRKHLIINVIDDSVIVKEREYISMLKSFFELSPRGTCIYYYRLRNINSVNNFFNNELDRKTKNLFFKTIRRNYNDLGGVVPAFNAALFISNYLIKKLKLNANKTIVTIHDDDVLYDMLSFDGDRYLVRNFDFLTERAEKFNNQNVQVVTTRVTHHTGSPYRMLCDVVNLLYKAIFSYKKYESFVLNGHKTVRLSGSKILDNAEKIIRSFIQRHPITSLYTSESNSYINKEEFTINGGAFSVRGSQIHRLVLPCFGIQDLSLTAIVRNTFSLSGFEVSHGLRHLRIKRKISGNASGSDLIGAYLRNNDLSTFFSFYKKMYPKSDFDYYNNLPNIRNLGIKKIFYKIDKIRKVIYKLKINEQSRKSIVNLIDSFYVKKELLLNSSKTNESLEISNQIKKFISIQKEWRMVLKEVEFKPINTSDKKLVLSLDVDGILRKSRFDKFDKEILLLKKIIKRVSHEVLVIINTNNSESDAILAMQKLGLKNAIIENGSIFIRNGINRDMVDNRFRKKLKIIKRKLDVIGARYFNERVSSIYIRDGELVESSKLFMSLFSGLGVYKYFNEKKELKMVITKKNFNKSTALINYTKFFYNDDLQLLHVGDDYLDLFKKTNRVLYITTQRVDNNLKKKFDFVLQRDGVSGVITLIEPLTR